MTDDGRGELVEALARGTDKVAFSALRRCSASAIGDAMSNPDSHALHMHPLNKLQVHDDALAFAQACYRHSRGISESDLRTQLLRSARSIAANLAEGAGCESQAVFARYVGIALASARESQSHVQMARISGQLSADQALELEHHLGRLMPRMYRLLVALRAKAIRRARIRS